MNSLCRRRALCARLPRVDLSLLFPVWKRPVAASTTTVLASWPVEAGNQIKSAGCAGKSPMGFLRVLRIFYSSGKKKERKDSELHVGKKQTNERNRIFTPYRVFVQRVPIVSPRICIYIYPRRVLWWHGVLTRLNRRLTSPRSREGKRRTKSLSLLRLFALPTRFIYTHFLRPWLTMQVAGIKK